MRRYLELASLLTNEWSLTHELCEDMCITTSRLEKLAKKAREQGINIEREEGKVRLHKNTTIDNVRFAIDMQG